MFRISHIFVFPFVSFVVNFTRTQKPTVPVSAAPRGQLWVQMWAWSPRSPGCSLDATVGDGKPPYCREHLVLLNPHTGILLEFTELPFPWVALDQQPLDYRLRVPRQENPKIPRMTEGSGRHRTGLCGVPAGVVPWCPWSLGDAGAWSQRPEQGRQGGCVQRLLSARPRPLTCWLWGGTREMTGRGKPVVTWT